MKNVLFIEDERRVNRHFVDNLKLLTDWRIIWHVDPVLALREYEKDPSFFDYVIIDIMMSSSKLVENFGAFFPKDVSIGNLDTGLYVLDVVWQLSKCTAVILILSARTDLQQLKDDPRIACIFRKPITAGRFFSEFQRKSVR